MKIVCDFDSTLYDTQVLIDAWLRVLEKYGVNQVRAIERIEEVIRKGFTLRGHAELLEIREPKIDELVADFEEWIKAESPSLLYADVIPFIDKNQENNNVSILTFGNSEFQHEKIQASGLYNYISDIRIACPERMKSVHLKEMLEETNQKLMFIDDNPSELNQVYDEGLPITLYRMKRSNSFHAAEIHLLDGDAWTCISSLNEIE